MISFYRRLTDLCDYCEKGRELREIIITAIQVLDIPYQIDEIELIKHHIKQSSVELDLLLAFNFEPVLVNKREAFKKLFYELEDYAAINYHKNIAKVQRAAYNDHHKNVETLRGKIMIELDYKEKIQIGHKTNPRQSSKEFYESTSRSFLGLSIVVVDYKRATFLSIVYFLSKDLVFTLWRKTRSFASTFQ
jgi:hypothetical protein